MKKLLLLTSLVPVLGYSQKIENWKAGLQGDKIAITYDLAQGLPGDKYNVSIYASHNNFSTPLQAVSGDVGKGISAGVGKQILWDGKSELKDFRGDLTFEIRVEVMAILAIKSVLVSAKRGKTMPISWRGGNKNQDVKIELMKAGVAAGVISNTANNGNFTWAVPPKQKTGSGYQLRLTNGSETVMSEPFAIKHKVPMLLKAAPIVAVAAILGLSGGGSKPGPTPASSNLAMPQDLGLN